MCVRERESWHDGKLTYDMTIDLQVLVCGGEKMMSRDLVYVVDKHPTKIFFMPMNINHNQMILIITF